MGVITDPKEIILNVLVIAIWNWKTFGNTETAIDQFEKTVMLEYIKSSDTIYLEF